MEITTHRIKVRVDNHYHLVCGGSMWPGKVLQDTGSGEAKALVRVKPIVHWRDNPTCTPCSGGHIHYKHQPQCCTYQGSSVVPRTYNPQLSHRR